MPFFLQAIPGFSRDNSVADTTLTDSASSEAGIAYDRFAHWLDNIAWEELFTGILVVLAGFFAGFLFEMFAISRLRKLTQRTPWKLDDALLVTSRGLLRWILGIISFAFIEWFVPLPPGAADFIDLLVLIGLTFIATIFLARLGSTVVVDEHDDPAGSSSLIRITIRIIVYIIGVLIILQSIGVNITALLGALGIGGLAVALALQDTLSNLFAGLQLILTRKFRRGDFIEYDDATQGYITDITWRNITLRTIHNNLIVIPNNQFAQHVVKNYNFPNGTFSVPLTIGVHYDSDLDLVERVTMEVAFEVQEELIGPLDEIKPFMWFHTFNNSSIDFNIMLQADEYRRRFPLAHAFIKRLHVRYNESGIEIPYPIRNLYFRNNLHKGDFNETLPPK